MGNSSKRRYDGKHRVTRIFLADYQLLKEFSQQAGLSMAEALHKLITREDRKEPVSPAQIRMPVTMAESMPVTTAYRSTPVTAIALNGSKAAAFKIKPKGVRHD